MKGTRTLLAMSAAMGLALATGCSNDLSPEPFDPNLRLTAGQVKLIVKIGETTQSEIFRSMGAPNVVAISSDAGEIWTYDQIKVRRSQEGVAAGAQFATIFSGSHASNWTDVFRNLTGAGGAEISGQFVGSTTSVRTATLIVRFDKNEKVASYNMLVTSF